ncbi:MAG: pyridoxamine 5'-phosphate oxidase family protein [Christensenellaceae bacterium]|jgi:general stress protein 26|nr:pyridoxamine 5'-phosphate oxidase family protein [Christensenellaceae bacterium]
MEQKTEKQIMDVIKKSKTSFLATVDEQGFPNVRAMLTPRKIVSKKEFWFTTNTSSNKVKQIGKNSKACVYFFDKKFMYHGVMLLGVAEVCTDQESRKEIWKFGDTMYYKEGVNDPDYAVIKFRAQKIKYYHAFKQEEFEI